MTIWSPDLKADRSGPVYLALADQLAEDLNTGKLKPGDQLPTHRDLAWKLGVTVGTITRAYAEARRRGLISGEVGRGTFIRGQEVDTPPTAIADDDFVDLARNFPTEGIADAVVAQTLKEITGDNFSRLLTYTPNVGLADHRAAAATWMARAGLNANVSEIAITAGAQHGMVAAMAALTRPDSIVLTEELTFYGMKSLATLLSLRLHGVAMDEYGIRPAALDLACRQTGAKALYCIPTLQNPTASIMPEERRAEIAAICRRHGVTIVEDDIYGFLPAEAPAPLSSHAPENSIYITSVSKCISPGLRVGFVRAPEHILERIGSNLRATTWMAPPMLAEITARLIRSGAAEKLVEAQRAEAMARQKIAAEILAGFEMATHPMSYHLWLTLPEPWRREEFTVQARRRGVGVTPADAFAVGRAPVPHAARLGISAVRDRPTLVRALTTIANVLRDAPERGRAMM